MRKAFTLIELIFAIIVISIAMMAIPPLLLQTTSSIEEIIKKEAIFQGMRSMAIILTKRWDENSIKYSNLPHILDVTNGDSELDRVSSSHFRIGSFKGEKRRAFFDNTTYPAALGSDSDDGSEKDDMDDYDGVSESISTNPGEFILEMKLSSDIFYIDDTATYSDTNITYTIPTSSTTASTNIKMATVTVKDKNDNNLVIFRAFACNIGGTDILYKDFK